MKRILTTFVVATAAILALSCEHALAQSTDNSTVTPSFKPTIKISRAQGAIRIDGVLTDPGWRHAAVATGFVETSPGDQVKPPVDSRALITYDDNNLYVALIAFDDPEDVRVSLRPRDDIYRDDYFGIMLDTYGDGAWGYELFVNPLGIQGDLRMRSTGGEDGTFDIVWYSEGMVTDSGYQVEIAIPFSSLRFPSSAQQAWRINFWRDHQRDVRRRYSWAAQDRDDGCFICQWGHLDGIENIEASSNFDIIPNVIATQAGSLTDGDDPKSGFDNADPDAEISFNSRYGLSSNSSAEITVNPDFSQVESDAGQIDVNSPFALFFPERRPFFQEGSDLYNSWINTVHTRTINDPQAAGKLTGTFGRWAVAYLIAQDENTPLIVPSAERSRQILADKATVNILRARRTFGSDSYAGLTFTDRRLHGDWSYDDITYSDGSGTVYGLDTRIRLTKSWHLEFQGMGSYTDEPDTIAFLHSDTADLREARDDFGSSRFNYGANTLDFDGEAYGGQAVYTSLERNGRRWNFDIDYWEFSPTFRTDNGFTTKNDYRQVSVWSGLFFRPNRSWLIEWEPGIGIGRIWDHGGEMYLNPLDFKGGAKDEWIRPQLWMNFKGQTSFFVQYLNSRERFSDILFEGISRIESDINTRFSESFGAGLYFGHGRLIYRDPDEPVMGKQTDFGAFLNLKPHERLFIDVDYRYAKMNHVDGYIEANPDEDREIFSGYILRSKTNFQFTRHWYLRLIVQYNNFADRVDVEPLLTWQLNPFTVFYIGSNNKFTHFDASDYESIERSEWELSSRQFFAKFQYLFRI